MQAGIAVLKDAGLFSSVAKDGLPIATAVAVGVTVREGKSTAGLPENLPLSVVLATTAPVPTASSSTRGAADHIPTAPAPGPSP